MTCGWKLEHQPWRTPWKVARRRVCSTEEVPICGASVAWPQSGSSPPRILSICRTRLLASSRPSERLGWRPASGDGRAFPCAAGRSTQFRGHGDGLLSASIRLHGELHAGGEAVHPSFLETTDARVLIRRHLKENRRSRPRLGKGLLQEEGCARSRRKGQTGSMLQAAQV